MDTIAEAEIFNLTPRATTNVAEPPQVGRKRNRSRRNTSDTSSVKKRLDFDDIPEYVQNILPRIHNNSETCAICLEKMTEGHVVRCLHSEKHQFHENCVLEGCILKVHNCPLCRGAW